MIGTWFYKLPGFQKCSVLVTCRKLFSCCKSQTSAARKGCKNFLRDTVTTSVYRAVHSVLKPGKLSPAFQTSGILRTLGSNRSPGVVKKENEAQTSSTEDVHSHQTISILQRLHDLEQSFNYRGYSVLRWGFISTIVLGFAIYVFREPLRENVADEVADVASRSLADENVIQKADEVTRAVLQDVLRDAEITKLASTFVMQVLQREDVKAAAIQLTQHVLHDPSTLNQIAVLAKDTLTDLLKNEDTRVLLLGYIKSLILDDSTRDACKSLLQELVKDPEVKSFMAASLGDLVTSTVVRNSAVELGKTVTHQVVNDATIQQETGNALWDVVKKTLTPGWFGYGSK